MGYGNATLPLAEFFNVARSVDDDALVFDGDLSRFDRVGWQMAGGRIVVEGSVGDYAGGCMSGGRACASAAMPACSRPARWPAARSPSTATSTTSPPAPCPAAWTACAAARSSSSGNAGARFGDRMRRGTALVFGDAGDFLASRMVAGTIAVGGRVRRACRLRHAPRQRRFRRPPARRRSSPTFVPALAVRRCFWQLLARDLARHGGPFAALPSRRIERHLGDLAAGGKGELILARS